jgi:protein transport protein SEC20
LLLDFGLFGVFAPFARGFRIQDTSTGNMDFTTSLSYAWNVVMSRSLTHRLQALYDSYKSTLVLIQELQTLTATDDTRRIELANDIHDALKEEQDTLDLLRQELDDTPVPSNRRTSTHQSTDHDRNADLIVRLTEDLSSARAKFRRAQLTAKRNADDAKRKERESLFKRKNDQEDGSVQPQPQRAPQGTALTQEELARNATADVTRALRRTHALMTSNLTQSQFAQQTLDESQTALKGLAENYGATGDLLKTSKGLVGTLMKSNKSDTWYLTTAFYLMAVTLSWLVFRRIFYGPLWWLVWQPLKLVWWATFAALGGIGLGGGTMENADVSSSLSGVPLSSATTQSGVNARGIPTNPPNVQFRSVHLPAKGAPWDGGPPPQQPPLSEQTQQTMVEEVGKMVDEMKEGRGTNVDDISDEERRRQEEMPRNPKKRMMEVDVESGKKDEL